MLLVLDNFEQLLAAAPFVGELLAAAPRVLVLATSRAPLRLAAEHEYPVPPFAAPDAELPFEALVQTDALRLFTARAHAVDPGFELDAASAPEVARLCTRLDGLPLAIELAAARSKLLAPAEILERLEREPNLPAPGRATLQPDSRRSPRRSAGATTSSNRTERLAFDRLGVFAGGCTLEAAEHVCETSLDTLAALVDNNLLRRRDSRFMMLETVRHFAVERIEQAGAHDTRQRHAEWLTELAESLEARTVAGEDVWLERIQPEHDNIRAALAWSLEEDPVLALRLASSLRLFWEVRGHFNEGIRWIEEALPRATAAPPELRMKALAVSGAIATRLHELDLAQERKEAALALARELGEDLWVARELSDLGTVAAMRDDFETASAMLEESAALFRELDEPGRLATALSNLGHIAGERGDYARAIEVTEESLSLQSSKANATIATYNLGSYHLEAGDLERAREWLERAVAVTFELGFKEVMAYALAAFVRVCLLEGDLPRAAYLAGIADRLLADAGVQLQHSEGAPFEAAKAAVEQALGDGYTAAHDAAFAAPLEEALRRGNVLADERVRDR